MAHLSSVHTKRFYHKRYVDGQMGMQPILPIIIAYQKDQRCRPSTLRWRWRWRSRLVGIDLKILYFRHHGNFWELFENEHGFTISLCRVLTCAHSRAGVYVLIGAGTRAAGGGRCASGAGTIAGWNTTKSIVKLNDPKNTRKFSSFSQMKAVEGCDLRQAK